MTKVPGLLAICALVGACAATAEAPPPPPPPAASVPAEPTAEADPVPEARPTAPVGATSLPPAAPR